jgi:hypothetical protein
LVQENLQSPRITIVDGIGREGLVASPQVCEFGLLRQEKVEEIL